VFDAGVQTAEVTFQVLLSVQHAGDHDIGGGPHVIEDDVRSMTVLPEPGVEHSAQSRITSDQVEDPK